MSDKQLPTFNNTEGDGNWDDEPPITIFLTSPQREVRIPDPAAAAADAFVDLAKAMNALVATFEVHEPPEENKS